MSSLIAQLVKNLPAMQETPIPGSGIPVILGYPCGSAGKKIRLQRVRPGLDLWVGNIPWRRERLPTPVFRPGDFHRLYSPWGPKELDVTE